MYLKVFRLCCWILLAGLCACKVREEKNDELYLELRLKEGETYAMTMEMEQSMEADVNSELLLIDQYFNFDILTTIIKDSAGQYVTDNRYQRIVMNQSMAGEHDTTNFSIDTDDLEYAESPSNNLLKYYGNLVTLSYQTRLEKNGTELYNNIEIINEEAGGKEFTSPFQKMFSYGVVFPGYVLKENDSWVREVSVRDTGIIVQGSIRYQLETWDDEVVIIQLKSRLKGRQAGVIGGGQVELEQSGTMQLYRKSGWLKQADLEQSIRWVDNPAQENRLFGTVSIRSERQ